ncbi:MAG: flagellar hook-length control protein FliK [Ruminiclostridium sp.]|nr:flagellar hook-length control protein FliK [Ruminiclostridium sp.]
MLNNLSDGTRSAHSERTVTTLTMTLNPESLGKITMKVSEEAGKISLVVTAHNKETAEILTQRMEAMQQAAKDSGTQLEKYQVVYGPEQDSRAGQQNYDGSSKNPYVRQDIEETQKDENGSQFADFLKQQAV